MTIRTAYVYHVAGHVQTEQEPYVLPFEGVHRTWNAITNEDEMLAFRDALMEKLVEDVATSTGGQAKGHPIIRSLVALHTIRVDGHLHGPVMEVLR